MRYDTWSDDWTLLALGVVATGEETIWYCISIYEADDEATLPLAA